jgi:hypothetical protein
LELLKLSSNVNECKPLIDGAEVIKTVSEDKTAVVRTHGDYPPRQRMSCT